LEERTQIKFENPDIDGTPSEKLITLEQENPIEGESARDNGEPFSWHKWLCINNEYFMASDSLDVMLKCIPDKTGKPIKIQKVVNPKGGYPFFMINGKSKDMLMKENQENPISPSMSASMPPQPSTMPASNTDGSLNGLEIKIDKLINMVEKLLNSEKESDLPF